MVGCFEEGVRAHPFLVPLPGQGLRGWVDGWVNKEEEEEEWVGGRRAYLGHVGVGEGDAELVGQDGGGGLRGCRGDWGRSCRGGSDGHLACLVAVICVRGCVGRGKWWAWERVGK